MAGGLMIIALGIDVLWGWPNWLFDRVRHPVVWIGALITRLDRGLNRSTYSHQLRYTFGVLTCALILAVVISVTLLIGKQIPHPVWRFCVEALLAASLLASRSLYEHVQAVIAPLSKGDLAIARQEVGKIVGRETGSLDESAIARASLESLAENMSDGVIAPLFWGALFGLPGMAAYKAINTLDSMIGHRSETYHAFGGFAARLDDLANLIPARLSGCLISAARFGGPGFSVMLRDAGQHRSPNAGWPEAAMAGALDVRLSGPRAYGDQVQDEPWLNPGRADPTHEHLRQGLGLYARAILIAALVLILISGARYAV